MKIVELQKKELDYTKFIKRSAAETDYEILLNEPTIGIFAGEIKFVYDVLEWDTSPIVEALKKIKYTTGQRARGLVSTSRIFGFRPRLAMRRDFCSVTSLAYEFPKEHALVCSFAVQIEELYKKNNPERYSEHAGIMTEKVKQSYRIQGGGIHQWDYKQKQSAKVSLRHRQLQQGIFLHAGF